MTTPAGYRQRFVRLRNRKDGRWLVHPDLRPRLVADAERKGVSLIDQVVGILAAKYGVPFEETPRKTTPSKEGEELNLILPEKLDAKIDRTKRSPQTIPDAIRLTLSAHYGLPVPPKVSRGRSVRPGT